MEPVFKTTYQCKLGILFYVSLHTKGGIYAKSEASQIKTFSFLFQSKILEIFIQ